MGSSLVVKMIEVLVASRGEDLRRCFNHSPLSGTRCAVLALPAFGTNAPRTSKLRLFESPSHSRPMVPTKNAGRVLVETESVGLHRGRKESVGLAEALYALLPVAIPR